MDNASILAWLKNLPSKQQSHTHTHTQVYNHRTIFKSIYGDYVMRKAQSFLRPFRGFVELRTITQIKQNMVHYLFWYLWNLGIFRIQRWKQEWPTCCAALWSATDTASWPLCRSLTHCEHTHCWSVWQYSRSTLSCCGHSFSLSWSEAGINVWAFL